MLLWQSIATTKKLFICGLAKHTGKTVALNALLKEAHLYMTNIGVTSIGRDGEVNDVINCNIKKPVIYLHQGTLVATTSQTLHESGLAFQVLLETKYLTPVGKVVIAIINTSGKIVVSGPSTAKAIHHVCEIMLSMGAKKVFIDGAINRKAAISPLIADAVVIAVGAVLDQNMSKVVNQVKDTVNQIRLKKVTDDKVLEYAKINDRNLLITDQFKEIPFNPHEMLLTMESQSSQRMLLGYSSVKYILLQGALCDWLAQALLFLIKNSKIVCIIRDVSQLFLNLKSYSWYESQGLNIQVLFPIDLKAITVNPVAPGSHEFDPIDFKASIRKVVSDIEVFNVYDAIYRTQQKISSCNRNW